MKLIAVQVLNETDQTFNAGYASTDGVRVVLLSPTQPGCTSIVYENNTVLIVKGTPDEIAALEATREF